MRHGCTHLIALALFGACLPAAAMSSGQCLAGETTYFSCNTARHKSISLCGALPSTLQYRYGKLGKPELQFPDAASDGVKKLLFAHYFRYQTERAEVTFSRGDVDYAVFDYTENGKRSAGVRVTLPDGSDHEMRCAGPIKGRLEALQKSLRCDTDNALNGGRCP